MCHRMSIMTEQGFFFPAEHDLPIRLNTSWHRLPNHVITTFIGQLLVRNWV